MMDYDNGICECDNCIRKGRVIPFNTCFLQTGWEDSNGVDYDDLFDDPKSRPAKEALDRILDRLPPGVAVTDEWDWFSLIKLRRRDIISPIEEIEALARWFQPWIEYASKKSPDYPGNAPERLMGRITELVGQIRDQIEEQDPDPGEG